MAALVSTVPSRTGTLSPGASVAASDTIDVSQLGARGAYLEILNGGASPDNVTLTDAGATPAGTPGGTIAATVTNGTNREFYVHPSQADPSTGKVTVTHSFLTSVTYKLRPAL